MSERESFEKWAAQHQTMDGYPQYTSFDAWVASRRAALEEGYAIGFEASGEGWNGEYPARDLTKDPNWLKERDDAIRALADGAQET